MKQNAFVVFAIILCAGLLQVYSMFRYHFSGIDDYRREVGYLQKELQRQKLLTQIQTYDFLEFQQQIATELPAYREKFKNDQQKTYRLRNLASIMTYQNKDNSLIDDSSRLFNEAREYFSQQNYKDATDLLSRLVERHPYYSDLPKAYFLLAEGQFLQKDYENCLVTVDHMLNHFPENDLTGFILLRMAQIYEQRDRMQEAEQVYRTVLNNYSNEQLKQQAQLLLRSLNL